MLLEDFEKNDRWGDLRAELLRELGRMNGLRWVGADNRLRAVGHLGKTALQRAVDHPQAFVVGRQRAASAVLLEPYLPGLGKVVDLLVPAAEGMGLAVRLPPNPTASTHLPGATACLLVAAPDVVANWRWHPAQLAFRGLTIAPHYLRVAAELLEALDTNLERLCR
jgi:hypothetical protein